ncbi:hypothetical protein GQ53DRAFT_240723 [Thozetella sp. PMI_491]|nr:hypothetical protein GQ53DRAFT_240723 [Thozetella sp. PMI_491]
MQLYVLASMALAVAGPVLGATSVPVNPANPTQTKMGVEEPSATPQLNTPVVQGCFSSNSSLVYTATPDWNSKDSCATTTCKAAGFKVAATTQGKLCYCGDTYPPESARVDDSKCDVECGGYGWDACGGATTFTVYNTGLSIVVDSDDAIPAAASSSTAKSSSTSVSQSTSTVVVTASSTAAAQATSSTNVAGIAAGVVVGVVALVGLSGLAFFLIRRRRNHEIEEEHRRNAAVNAFINGSKPPGSSDGMSMSDSRLDPVMAQRRMSSGSIADNEDYSRRILRVTNA